MDSIGMFAFALAMAVSYLLTVAIRGLAPQIGLTDRPDGRRKLHGRATPLGGGVAVFLAAVMILAGLWAFPNPWQSVLQSGTRDLVALFLSGAVIVVVGLIDDRVGLRGRHKVVGQLAAVAVLIINGLVIERLGIWGTDVSLGILAVPFTMFWLFGAINSVNLLDGIDGLATLLGAILAGTFALLATMGSDRPQVAIVATVFAGSLLGFLRFNLPPASIFLGDAGSMLIGLVVGVLAIQGSLKAAGTVLLAAPLAAWTVPIFDSAAAILRRKLVGRSIYTTDRAHLHHHLLNRLGSNTRVLVFVAIACALTSTAALASAAYKSDSVALLAGCAVVVIFISTGLFGRAEFQLLLGHLRQILRRLLPRYGRHPAISQNEVRLQGSQHWELLWDTLTESAHRLQLCKIQLDLNAPMIHESYHATWERPMDESTPCWHLELPLVADGHLVGRLTIAGARDAAQALGSHSPVLALLDPIESQLQILLATPPGDPHEAFDPLACRPAVGGGDSRGSPGDPAGQRTGAGGGTAQGSSATSAATERVER